jgi:RNA-splicing ligase RtcB
MSKTCLHKEQQHLLLFKQLEQINASKLQQQHHVMQQKLQQAEQHLANTGKQLTLNQAFSTKVFSPELQQLQLHTMLRLQREIKLKSEEVAQLQLKSEALQSAFAASHVKTDAYHKASSVLMQRLRALKAERQDQQINELHYQRKYNGHG